jgi:hypothetical protein
MSSGVERAEVVQQVQDYNPAAYEQHAPELQRANAEGMIVEPMFCVSDKAIFTVAKLALDVGDALSYFADNLTV